MCQVMGLLVVPGTWIVACSSMLYVLPPSVTLHYWLSGYCNLCVKVALIYQLISKLNNSHATIWSMPKINQKLLLLSEQEKTLHLIRKKKSLLRLLRYSAIRHLQRTEAGGSQIGNQPELQSYPDSKQYLVFHILGSHTLLIFYCAQFIH